MTIKEMDSVIKAMPIRTTQERIVRAKFELILQYYVGQRLNNRQSNLSTWSALYRSVKW